jgi:hypothetical protein
VANFRVKIALLEASIRQRFASTHRYLTTTDRLS